MTRRNAARHEVQEGSRDVDVLDPITMVTRRATDFFQKFHDRVKLQDAQQQARIKLLRQNNFRPTPEVPVLPDK